MLNKSGKNGYLCSVPSLRARADKLWLRLGFLFCFVRLAHTGVSELLASLVSSVDCMRQNKNPGNW